MKRYWALVVCLLVGLAVFVVPSASADTGSNPSDPSSLAIVGKDGRALSSGGWINANTVSLRFQVQVAGGPLTPQVEVAPAASPFTGKPTSSGSALTATGTALVRAAGLQNGTGYHWQARVVDAGGNASNWVTYGSGGSSPDFSVDKTPPARPVISSPTNPDQNRWYNTATEVLHWQSHDRLSGVAGYSFALERQAHVIPPGALTPTTGAKISNLSDGTWFLALRAEDRAGNWSPTATFRLQLDRTPARLIWLSPNRFQFNPYVSAATVRFRLSKDASARLTLFRVGSKYPVATFPYPSVPAGRVITLTWSGKNSHGKPVQKGYYFFTAQLVDHASNLTRLNVGGIVVDPQAPHASPAGPLVYADGGKRIIVSLSQQTLYAYDGDRLALRTYVTTGNPSLPTPAGHYTVLQKLSPFEFISPWPPSSPYWYAPSWVKYAMLFRDGGYYLHDAPWRSAFGPGTNGAGQPGTNYGGTHGCVNIPPGPMTFLWNWAPVGTTVDVVP